MKTFLILITAFTVVSADAAVLPGREPSPQWMMAAIAPGVSAPVAAPTQVVPQPQPPVIVQAPPIEKPDNFIQYLWMTIAGVIGAMFGAPKLKEAFGSGDKKQIVSEVLHE